MTSATDRAAHRAEARDPTFSEGQPHVEGFRLGSQGLWNRNHPSGGQRFFIETDDGHYWHPVPDLEAFALECGAIGR